jgi:hypothetical protein
VQTGDPWFATDDPAGWEPRESDPEWWSDEVDPLHIVERHERSSRRQRRWMLVYLAGLALLVIVFFVLQ